MTTLQPTDCLYHAVVQHVTAGAQSLPPRHRSLGIADLQQPLGLTAAAAGLPTTSSCLDLLTAGRTSSAPNRPSKLQPTPPAAADSSTSSSNTAPQQQQQQQQRSSLDGIAPAVLSSISSFHSSSIQQQDSSSRSLSKLGSMNASGSLAWNVRQAEARAAALSGIRAMPERPLALLYQLVELMKVRWCCTCVCLHGECADQLHSICDEGLQHKQCKLAINVCAVLSVWCCGW
jgi:hypothetical protein